MHHHLIIHPPPPPSHPSPIPPPTPWSPPPPLHHHHHNSCHLLLLLLLLLHIFHHHYHHNYTHVTTSLSSTSLHAPTDYEDISIACVPSTDYEDISIVFVCHHQLRNPTKLQIRDQQSMRYPSAKQYHGEQPCHCTILVKMGALS